jgi:excisionase family DNA binding protein
MATRCLTEQTGVAMSAPSLPRTLPSAASPHRLISVGEAARLLACSSMTIRRRIDQRCFPAVRIGSKVSVPRAFVESVLAKAEAGETVVIEEAAAAWLSEANGSEVTR